MAAGISPQTSFTNDEKNFLLAELIKAAAPQYNILLDVFNRLQAQPRLQDIPLPPGRSYRECQIAFDDMRRWSTYSPMSSTGVVPTPLSATAPTLKRPSYDGQPSSGRPLLPKTGYNPYPPMGGSEPPLKRKRGRPTKAEQQARAAEAASMAGEMSAAPPAPRTYTPMSASVPPSPVVDTHSAPSRPSGSRGMPISTIITTPAPKSASHSGSSSGKKRRQKRSEDVRGEPSRPAQPTYSTSPYPHPDDTPARARYRDDPILSSVAGLRVSEPEQTLGASQTASTSSPRIQLPPPPPGPRSGR